MGVQLVHGLAESLVRVVSRLNPCAIGVRVANEFAEVNDTAEHVAEPVQVLDDLEELLAVPEQLTLCSFLFCRQLGG